MQESKMTFSVQALPALAAVAIPVLIILAQLAVAIAIAAFHAAAAFGGKGRAANSTTTTTTRAPILITGPPPGETLLPAFTQCSKYESHFFFETITACPKDEFARFGGVHLHKVESGGMK